MCTLTAEQELTHIINIQSNNSQSRQSLDILIRHFHRQISALAWKMSQSGQFQDDLYQEGVLGLIECIQRFDISRSIRLFTFSFQRIKGRMKDWLRKEGKYRSMIVNTESSDEVFDQSRNGSVDYEPEMYGRVNYVQFDIIEVEESCLLIERALEKLPERQRRVIILSYWHDCKTVDIANRLGISQPRVSVLISKGLKNLRKEVSLAA